MIFLNSVSSATALVFYLSGVCTHTETKGKQREARVRNILKSLANTIFNEHLVHIFFIYYVVSKLLRWEFIKERFKEKRRKTRFQPRKKERFKKKRKHAYDQERK